MPYIEPAGIKVERPATPETEKNSSAPLRTCDSMSVSPPSWLLGNTLRANRPSLSFQDLVCSFQRTGRERVRRRHVGAVLVLERRGGSPGVPNAQCRDCRCGCGCADEAPAGEIGIHGRDSSFQLVGFDL